VNVNGAARDMVLYTNGSQQLAYVCSDSQINIVDVTNATSPLLLSTFAGSVLTAGGTVAGFQVMQCTIDGSDLIVSFSRHDGDTSNDPTAVPTYFATFSLSNPLSPTQVGSTVSIDRPDSYGLYVQGSSALMAQTTTVYDPYTNFITNETGDVWRLDLTNVATTGSVAFISDLYPCGGINSSTSACNDSTNVPAATYTDGVCASAGTIPVPNDQYEGGPYPIYKGVFVNSTTANFGSSTAYGGNVEDPSCPTITGQLLVINGSNTSSLAIDTSVTVPQAAFVTGVAIEGNTAVVVGDTTGIYDLTTGFVGNLVIASFDITNPQSPVLKDTIVTPLTDNPGADVVPIRGGSFVVGNVSSSGGPELAVVNASNPSTLSYTDFSWTSTASVVTANSTNVYALSQTSGTWQLQVFLVSAF
jgi:hypothetical protein